MADALQEETAEVLGRLIRFDTVNPPGAERAAQEWLEGYLRDAGFDTELGGPDPERPNLVARLRGEAPDGPVLGYLSHMDTVLASPEDWTRDPWSGELDDGFVWGRGAIDMKSQTAAEAVAGARLARDGWRPARGELKIICVADEEAGGGLRRAVADRAAPRPRPLSTGCSTRAAAPTCPSATAASTASAARRRGRSASPCARAASPGTPSIPGMGDNALVKLGPVLERLATRRPPYDLTEEPRALIAALGLDPDDPAGAVAAMREAEPRLAVLFEPTLGVTMAPTRIAASEKINVIPARAELKVDCRVPPGMAGEETDAPDPRGRRRRRLRARLHRGGGGQPLADGLPAHGRHPRLGRRARSRRPRSCRWCCPPSPTPAGFARPSPTAWPTASSRTATRRCTRPGR